MREGAIVRGSVGASGVWKGGGSAAEVGGKLRWIVEIEGWILRELNKMFSSGSKRAAEHWFVDEIYAKAQSVAARGTENVVAELIFLLIARDGERGDDGGELIVAESLESGSGVKICAERKRQRQA